LKEGHTRPLYTMVRLVRWPSEIFWTREDIPGIVRALHVLYPYCNCMDSLTLSKNGSRC